MSTESTKRKRAAFRKSNIPVTPYQSSPLPSCPVASIKKSRGRPSLGSISTNSSASSTSSGTFDVEKRLTPRPESPTTPTCETPPPRENKDLPELRVIAQTIHNLPHSEPKPKKRHWADGNQRQSSEIEDTPIKTVRKRVGARKPNLSKGQQHEASAPASHLAPRSNVARHQRASSAPPLPSKGESMDGERPRMPGGWDSQRSKIDVENFEGKQILHTRTIDQQQRERDTGQPADPAVLEDGSMDDAEPRFPDMPSKKDSSQYDDESPESRRAFFRFLHLLLAYFNPLKWLIQLTHILLDPVPPTRVSECLPPPFTPYTCEDGHPQVRRLNGRRSIHTKMLEHIQEIQDKPEESGWVYVLESKEYGPEFIKVGISGNPDERRRQLQRQCGLHLEEISDKNENPFHFFQLVEKLVLQELDDDRLRLQCKGPKCTTLHKEWAKICRKRALEAIVKWRNWLLIQKPFDDTGRLTPYWADRAKRLRVHIVDVQWEQWTQPSRWDLYMFLLKPHIFYYVSLFKKHFAHDRKDLCFWIVGLISTFLSFEVYGGKEAIWFVVILLLL